MISFVDAELKVRDIKAHCGPTQGEWLFNLVRGLSDKSNICEIGTFYGYITAMLGFACEESNRRVYAIDHFLGRHCMLEHPPFFYTTFVDNLVKLGLWNKIIPFPMKSMFVFPLLHMSNTKFDLIYFDGDHGYENMMNELEQFSYLVNVGGYMCGDDCDTNNLPFSEYWGKMTEVDKDICVKGAIFTFFKNRPDFTVLDNTPSGQFGFKRIG